MSQFYVYNLFYLDVDYFILFDLHVLFCKYLYVHAYTLECDKEENKTMYVTAKENKYFNWANFISVMGEK